MKRDHASLDFRSALVVRCKSENGIEDGRQVSHSFQQEMMPQMGMRTLLCGTGNSKVRVTLLPREKESWVQCQFPCGLCAIRVKCIEKWIDWTFCGLLLVGFSCRLDVWLVC